MSKSRAYSFTINNYNDDDCKKIIELKDDCRYIIVGKEVGDEKKTPHLQGYVYFESPRYMKAISKKYLPRAHIEISKGSAFQNQSYCEKDGNLFLEFGTKPEPGKRVDLILLKKKISEGLTVDEIALDNPMAFHQYGRTLQKIEDITLRKKFRNFMTKCIWIYGPTGTGKSKEAFSEFTPETHYVLNLEDNGWWEGYKGQKNVIINEFRGQIKFCELLDLIDRYPKTVKRRNREPVPFISELIYITSSMHPRDIYKNISGDNIDQLLRRVHIECTTSGTLEH